ncbi:hypothetical protein HZH66_002558 [Vespula vulgaris]|uniref:G-protein coupled receptors family 1 profile domain-containing protein n=1 Tax=Vespula vulgaris TaxID=7454 RepID=A0A834KJN0_VESVU|nr:hypothetical protein HZH66_002558 [Vespula vulgaris]
MDALPTSKSDSSPLSAESICAISEGATALMTTSSVLSVFLIAIDQYFAVVDPLRYRAKVDKLKSGILIISVWLISSIFALLAFLNPNPRSLWLSCNLQSISTTYLSRNSSINLQSNSSFGIIKNNTADIETEWIEFVDYAPNESSMTYGTIYTVVHSIFAYLLPFTCVCWIYVKIYSAAHRNSERTRRTGSRPILSSASFCEDQKSQQQQHQQVDNFVEEFRRIPKISSLSSIDETSETTQPAGSQVPRGRSFSSALDIHSTNLPSTNEASSSGTVVFTVGPDTDECSHHEENEKNISNKSNLPISTQKAEFMEKDEITTQLYLDPTKYDLVKSRFLDRPDQRRKLSHNLMYDQMLLQEGTRGSWLNNDGITDLRNSDTEEDFSSEHFRPTIEDEACRQQKPIYLSPYSTYETALNRNEEKDGTEVDGIYTTQSLRINETFVRTKDGGNTEESDRNKFERSTNRKHYDGLPSDFEITEVIVDNCDVFNVENTGKPTEIVMNGANTETSACLLTPIVTITPAPNKSTLHRVASVKSTSSYINSLKYRISNGSLFRYREETRAARISALVIVMGLICWSPYEILLLLKNLPPYNDRRIAHEYDVTALCFLVLAAYVSPLLFGYRSKRVKRELRKFFCFKKELSYKNNRSLMAKKVLKRRHSNTFSNMELENRYNIFNCVYGRNRWPKEKVQFVQVPDTALAVETCRSSFSSGASTQISSTSTDDC